MADALIHRHRQPGTPGDSNMPSTYHTVRGDGQTITADSIEGIVETLRSNQAWPAGSYKIDEMSDSLPPGHIDLHWGIAVKNPDGTVYPLQGVRL